MVTDSDHIEALRKRLLERQREKENELSEIKEMVRVLVEAPKILSGKASAGENRQEQPSGKIGKPINLNLSKHVDDYLASFPYDQGVNLKEMIRALKSDYGVVGKDESLYSYLHSLLKKKRDKNELSYEKGVGFYKKRDSDKKDSQLVAQA